MRVLPEPVISLIIPTYNEEAFIGPCLDSLLRCDTPYPLEILVLDGRSNDRTPAVLAEYQARYPQLRVLENEDRVQVKGLNQGIRESRGRIVLRCDAHCEYPRDYIRRLVEVLERGEADNVGGTIETLPSGDSLQARAIAWAMNHPFGVGLSFRTRKLGSDSVEVDTVPFGAWYRTTLQKLEGFDESFVRAQDLELNLRIRQSGGRVLLLPTLVTRYFARSSLQKLLRLAWQMGYAKMQVAYKHGRVGSLRQLFPPLLALGLLPALFWWPLASAYQLYLAMAMLIALWGGIRLHSLLAVPIVFAAFLSMHFSYGAGYLLGFVEYFLLRKGRSQWQATR